MRLAGPDVVLFIVGAVMFGGAMYGLAEEGAFSGGATSAFGAFTLTWASTTVDVSAGSFQTEPTAPIAFTVTEAGITQIDVEVACSYTTPAPGVTTTIDATLTGPNGQTGSGSGACGTPFAVTFDIEPAPEGGAVEAENEVDAETTAQAGVGVLALGDWSGELQFTQTTGAPTNLPVQVQYSGTVTATLTQFVADAAPVTR